MKNYYIDLGSSTIKVYCYKNELELLEEHSIYFKNDFDAEKGISKNNLEELCDYFKEIKSKYGHARKTILEDEIEEIVIDKVSTVIKEDVMIAISRDGYAKRSQLKSYNSSNSSFPGYKQTDAIVAISQASTLDTLLVFTSGGNFMYLPVYELVENKWKDEKEETHEKEVLGPGSNAGNGAFFGTCDSAGNGRDV